MKIAVSGKGGTGKTLIVALITKYLLKKASGNILVVDADPNYNLNEFLGIKVEHTIGEIREETLGNISNIPYGMTKQQFLEYHLHSCIVESNGFDYVAMGRPEGNRCYCYINSLLRDFMDELKKNYNYIIMDNEAGMEHLSRKTTYDADFLFIVAENSLNTIRAAERIFLLSKELDLQIKNRLILINKVKEELLPQIKEKLKLGNFFIVQYDNLILELEHKGETIFSLSEDSIAYRDISSIIEKIKNF